MEASNNNSKGCLTYIFDCEITIGELEQINISMDKSYISKKDEMGNKLKSILKGNEISSSALKSLCFPDDKYDVFISHSHNDLKLAKKFSKYLKENFNLNCFVDSCVWGNIAEISREINDEYNFNKQQGTYGYENHEYFDSHLNMILGTSLTKIMDSCICVFFLNTPNSIKKNSELVKNLETYSPWIYYELMQAKFLRKNPISLGYENIKEEFSARDSKIPQISYLIEKPDEMACIKFSDIIKCKEENNDLKSADILKSFYRKSIKK